MGVAQQDTRPAHRERGEEEKQGGEIALSVKVGKLTRGKGKKRERDGKVFKSEKREERKVEKKKRGTGFGS